MGDTVYARFIDEIVRRFARDKSVSYLRSDQYPTLRLRYSTDRRRGVWDVLHWDGWHRVGNYPDLDCSTMLECLPRVVAQLRRGFAVDPSKPASCALKPAIDTVGRVVDRSQQGRRSEPPRSRRPGC
jgi:hypothetical protein